MTKGRLPLTVAALGIVFGDIGTSPLYAFREAALAAPDQLAPSVLGVLSLIVWAIALSIGVKYVGLVLRLDNDGEGGILALATLLKLHRRETRPPRALVAVALVGAAMLFGDGVITPAISVLSAVEGLEFAAPRLADWDVLVTVAVLVALYASQRFGTHRIGTLFGPVMLVWFAAIAALGAAAVAAHPAVLAAANPLHGLALIAEYPLRGAAILAAVFLAITGGEALYADLGPFGRPAIARAWFTVAMPALVLNYFGQGALILADPTALRNPFYLLAPPYLQIPLVLLATAATVIASQAVITGVFSLASQAIETGFLVPLKVTHTAPDNERHVYLGSINTGLALLSIATVLHFRTSDALADAYGLAVAAAMITTTILFVACQVRLRRWPRGLAIAVGTALLSLDLSFFIPNLGKLETGGWLPLSLAGVAILAMLAWRYGTARLVADINRRSRALTEEARRLDKSAPTIERPVVFLTRSGTQVPTALGHLEDLLGLGFARVVVVSVKIAGHPRVAPAKRLRTQAINPRLLAVELNVGYMQAINLPSLIAPALREAGIDPNAVIYAIGYERALAPQRIRGIADVLSLIFVFLQRNCVRVADQFGLPAKRTLEVGYRLSLEPPAGAAPPRPANAK
jgi:KUP system potassium uptake protein